jgi:hypothetical protein
VFKKFSTYLLKKIYKMGCLEGSGVPVLYIGRTVPTRCVVVTTLYQTQLQYYIKYTVLWWLHVSTSKRSSSGHILFNSSIKFWHTVGSMRLYKDGHD